MTELRAGDTLYVRGGTYTSEYDTIDSDYSVVVPSGTSWENAITIAGYQSETVTVFGRPRVTAVHQADGRSPHYLIFQDLVIDTINDQR